MKTNTLLAGEVLKSALDKLEQDVEMEDIHDQSGWFKPDTPFLDNGRIF